MKLRLLFCCMLAGVMLAKAGQPKLPEVVRAKFNFNPGWVMQVGDNTAAAAFGFDDKSWKAVTLPHAFNEDDAFKKPIQDLTTGIVWYRKHFTIPNNRKGQKVFLEFEGIRQAGEFYLNGQWIGRHENGITAFGFDITDSVKFGEENVLAVRIDNSWDYHEKESNSGYQWNDKNFYANYGGINKNVYLHFMPKIYQTLPLYSNLHTKGVYVYASQFDVKDRSALINVQSEIRNESDKQVNITYIVTIADKDGAVIRSFRSMDNPIGPGETRIVNASGRAGSLHFWSWGYGYLYQVYSVLMINGKTVDIVRVNTGFRKTGFSNGVFQLNDRPMHLKGYAQRTTNEWPAIGNAVPAWMSDHSNGLMVESGANLVRWMHVTPWKQDVESCDRMGLMEAMPAGDSEKDVDGRRWEQRVEVMRDAMIYNRNNPSIVFYECGNKGISEEHMKQMKELRDQWDPMGGRAIGSREMLQKNTVAEYGGEMLYINKSAGKPLWAMEYSRDEGLRKYWDEFSPPFHKEGVGPLYKGQPANEYNHNQDAHAIEDVTRWYDFWKERPGTGKRVNAGAVNIIFSESNTHYRGESNYRTSGEVDAMRIPKDGFYAHQAMWDGWVDDLTPHIHILGHWNYSDSVTKDIHVVSNADRVELFVNERSYGFAQQTSRFLYTFKRVKWQPGVIRAVGYTYNKKSCETEHVTAGRPVAVKLTPITAPKGWVANGADLAMVQVEVVDEKGNRCPTALNTIQFAVDGPAEWRGGIAQGPDNYILSKELPVECGVNRVLLRSATQAGAVTIKATSGNLTPATLQLTTLPFEVKEGLAVQMPDDGLTGSLKKDNKPDVEPYVVNRLPMIIARATAGCNQDKAAEAFDDDETTDWFSNGIMDSSWIAFETEYINTFNAITLKLNNFRTCSYPIRILVDKKEVFKGNTPRGLGYFTIEFAAYRGKKVRVELLSAADVKGDKGTEMNGKKLGDGVEREEQDGKARLSIIEAELYGPLNQEP
ncbi:beta-galactosidase [Filimonas lacunae]|uniref:Beta-galactosidase n=1 Tax=Filimonas lacunae TaxID=477680 RepID=A0A173MMH9_9BACT|nr:sugar-binding domain-containing protein [Filimonas lacunae]BAV08855.1 beta-galactosidase [Filimonas lacunae]SIS62837.1 beta-galactosidase [Filimonas lacunae]